MGKGIDSHFTVSPVAVTVAGTAINTTTAATAVTISYVNTDHVMLAFENTCNTTVVIARAPVSIDYRGATVTGTAEYFKTLPSGSYRVFDLKANAVGFGPAVYRAYATGTPASGIVEMITVPAK